MPTDQRDPAAGAPVGRRVFLGLLGLGALGTVTGTALQDGLSAALAPIQTRDPTGLVSLLPLGNTFRYYSVTGGVDEQDAGEYRLAVSGLVQRTGRHTLADLAAMPQTELVRDFQCVTGWRVPDVRWSGVRLADLIDLAGPDPAATAVRFSSFDGTYTESLTLEQARRPDVLVALRMLDGPVTHDHGGPVRLYVAPMYGYKSLKWLSGIELTRDVEPGYWEDRGYSVDAWVGSSNGRADDPTS
ncbi:molybdopterin-dependent oxidoreductase [Modestobacter versicolor]|uniref:DMSO/TMAO reductase YedYZ molybdopterin-dependent catalytic subunit n=1 Tax=Modestobacter versicolor TaxID=429133 RepID=A0A323VAW1_9ACTN|nr:molybdopterin-dependent oxidoreductase [Modestobacter versicolor]MBB3676195.1 DMSO/TMAO reductase YedYZ molybdopterin-dependent catalytic subunit [Modestobacter versicolor]PZA21917.1 oxidoreductase [Modestobacter versicolor]